MHTFPAGQWANAAKFSAGIATNLWRNCSTFGSSATDGSGLLDIDLEGHRREEDSNRGGTVAPAVLGYRLIAWSSANELTLAGECRDIAGLFHERPDS